MSGPANMMRHYRLLFCLLPAFSAVGDGAKPMIRAVDYMDLPTAIESLQPLEEAEVSLALDEYEPLALVIHAKRELNSAALQVSGLPAGVSVKLYRLTEHTRVAVEGKERVVREPYFMEERAVIDQARGAKSAYYLVFRAQVDAHPGKYRPRLMLAGASLRVRLTVHPFRLRELGPFFYGAFCGRTDLSITRRHLADLHELGFDALQFFWGSLSVGLSNQAGKLGIDFSLTDRWMEDVKAAGMRGPIVWSLGNDSSSHLETLLAELFHLPMAPPAPNKCDKPKHFADIHNVKLNQLLKELLLAIRAHGREKQWPEIVILIYDEPTECLMAEHEDRYKFIKSFWPEVRIYGVTMNRIAWAEAIAHMVDIFVSNGDYARIRELADRSGKPFWMYSVISSRPAYDVRHTQAWLPWKFGAGGSWFWAYNYYAGNPYDDSDGYAETTASVVWPAREEGGPLVYSVTWAGMREAVDDMRYLRTLEWMLAQSTSQRAGRIRGDLAAMRESIPKTQVLKPADGDENDKVEATISPKYVKDFRRRVAGWINEMFAAEPALRSYAKP
ncbi:MAG: hypothetical protein HZB13_12345 [Acidobacteria bacterium]|nr:hypothetical protein [Acidobacteriota bacterium]